MKSIKFVWLVFLPLLMGAEYYQYTDKNGVVTFSQQKPQGVKAEHIMTRDGGPNVTVKDKKVEVPVEQPKKNKLSPEQQAELERLKKVEKARLDEIARIKQSNCKRSKDLLAKLQSRGRIRVKGEDGQETVMPETEREQRIADAQKNIAEYCVASK